MDHPRDEPWSFCVTDASGNSSYATGKCYLVTKMASIMNVRQGRYILGAITRQFTLLRKLLKLN